MILFILNDKLFVILHSLCLYYLLQVDVPLSSRQKGLFDSRVICRYYFKKFFYLHFWFICFILNKKLKQIQYVYEPITGRP